MAPPKKVQVSMAGVAEGKELVPISIDDGGSAEERVRSLLEGAMGANPDEGWGFSLIREHIQLQSASANPGRAIFKYTVQPSHCNRLGNLHGGCAATLFDVCTTTSLAPIAKEGFWAFAGVSRTLNVTYIRPVPAGETVLIDCEVVHAGKTMCALKGQMRRESDGAVMAICEHGKVSIDPPVASKL